ncbi:hypothetical protein OBBRIDRAFT_802655 [Obba rivulosa]|uniref:Aminoglycoside phosphotransferase domain-containing protein n=1 Tax=Obba rivulosa TaxID=1052685 RepID=A0A8E2DMN4_9APHY|nr:hypothetical protein OBBRIDRAFT_802655 [Obba rivulosa]
MSKAHQPISISSVRQVSSSAPRRDRRYVRFGASGPSPGFTPATVFDVRTWSWGERIVVGVLLGGRAYYAGHLEKTPVTGHRRFMDVSPKLGGVGECMLLLLVPPLPVPVWRALVFKPAGGPFSPRPTASVLALDRQLPWRAAFFPLRAPILAGLFRWLKDGPLTLGLGTASLLRFSEQTGSFGQDCGQENHATAEASTTCTVTMSSSTSSTDSKDSVDILIDAIDCEAIRALALLARRSSLDSVLSVSANIFCAAVTPLRRGGFNIVYELQFSGNAHWMMRIPFDEWNDFRDELGPFNTTHGFLVTLLAERRRDADSPMPAALQLFLGRPERQYDSAPFALGHPDFDSQNVLVDDTGEVTGLIDWDGVAMVPVQLGALACPAWLTVDSDQIMYDLYKEQPHHDSEADLHMYRKMYTDAVHVVSGGTLYHHAQLACGVGAV